MQFVRLVVFGFVALSVVYISLAVYSRSVRREKLENQYDENPVPGMTREAFVNKGIAEYNNSLRPKLLLAVYIVPTLVAGTIIYFTNAN